MATITDHCFQWHQEEDKQKKDQLYIPAHEHNREVGS